MDDVEDHSKIEKIRRLLKIVDVPIMINIFNSFF
jgi:hypothetical protein